MTIIITLIVAIAIIVAAGLIRQRVKNNRRFLDCLVSRDSDPNPLPVKRLRHNIFSIWFYERIFGVYFAAGTWLGNCFSPAVVLEWHGKQKPSSSHDPLNEERLEGRPAWWVERYRKYHAEKLAAPEVISYPAWASLTLRFKGCSTRIYWRGWWRLDWDSEHIARKFGNLHEADHGDCWFYKGWLGNHQYV